MNGYGQAGAWLFIVAGTAEVAWVTYDAVRDRCRIGADPLRYLIRLAWYKLTRRMPGRCPRRDPYRLSVDDAIAWRRLTTIIRQRGIWADDPQRERGRSS